MTSNSVCAVVVTFHPQPETLQNVAKLRPQVEGLVVVDNGSSEDRLALLRAASDALDFELIENGENLGLATALNIGVRWAQSERNYRFVALFDQDSVVTDGFIDALLTMYESNSHREKIGIIGAAYAHPVTGHSSTPGLLAKDGRPLEVMTSGSLLPLEVFDHCGYFQEDLIIDRVDYEYCFRIRDSGYTISLCPQALLIHAAGSPAKYNLFGKTIATFSNHGAARWYYIARNSILLLRKYGTRYPEWACASIFFILIKAPIKIFLVKDRRWKKFHNFLRGVADGIIGRTGKRVSL